ncbi:hypothetical protein [Microbacterium invictum]|uniref:Uncharacterized protein n=1 Tax=Microbacterium invictum TaxID=515415 RepID=A0AA40SQ88_9MICO|nr:MULTISPECIES: hypothetical protein [Microbacterium]MBB4140425.1 hypothetical protein [Microbacterium invictum]
MNDLSVPEHLAGVVAKFIRARDLLNELDGLALEYLIAHPASFDVVPHPESNSYTVTAHVDPPPLRLAVVFGDALHNMRSVLDHLARLLVVAHGGQPVDRPPGATMFPIHMADPGRPVTISPGISDRARTVLTSLQPFLHDDPRSHPLWRLSELNNIDKHRLLHVTSLSGAGGVAFVPAPLDPTVPTTQEQRRHTVRLLPEQPQTFTVTAEEMHVPAAMAGTWSYTVVLGEPDAGFTEQLVGIGRTILTFLAEAALPELAPFTSPTR